MPDAISMCLNPPQLDQRRAAVDMLVIGRVTAIRTLHRLVDDQTNTRAQRLVPQGRIWIVDGLLYFSQALDVQSPACVDEMWVLALPADPGCVACQGGTGSAGPGVEALGCDG